MSMSRETKNLLIDRLEHIDKEIKRLENEYSHIAGQLMKHDDELPKDVSEAIRFHIRPKEPIVVEKMVSEKHTTIKVKKAKEEPKKFVSSLDEEQREANRLGLSYGKYQALKQMMKGDKE